MRLCMGCMERIGESERICPHCGFEEGTAPEQANQMLPGSILREKYIVGRVIGYGGFGVTYIGQDAELERKVAIKEYMPSEFSGRAQGETKVTVYEGDGEEQFRAGLEKFVGEAKRLAKFQSVPGIVQIYDSFLENNTAYIVMEYLDGETLKERLKREGKLPLEDALGILLPIISSLKEIHKEGIIHRDIAPDNIMLTKDGEAKLIDFGASRFETATHSRSLTVLIKQGYAPVEQYNSRGDQGSWTDVYALAATFYKMLTGVTPEDAMERKASDTMRIPSKAGAKVGKNIDTAVMNALNIGIEYRTRTMEDFERELLSDGEVTRVIEPDHRTDVGRMPVWAKTLIGCAAAGLLTFAGLLATGRIPMGTARTGLFRVAEGMTNVPNFVNQYYEDAVALAQQSGVGIQITDSIYSDEIEQDMVCEQDLPTGKQVVLSETVYLTVSAGKRMAEVPTVAGLSVEEASALLIGSELRYEIAEVYSYQAAGSVLTQSVEALTQMEPGSVIYLEVSLGPDPEWEFDPEREVELPELVGKSIAEAQELLGSLGILFERRDAYDASVRAGLVSAQSEKAGTVLHQGDQITLTVSLGKQMVTVPYVQFKTEAAAIQLLEGKGLKASVSYEYSESVAQGVVISQNPASNVSVDAGTAVAIVVSRGAQAEVIAQADADTGSGRSGERAAKEWSAWSTGSPDGIDSAKYEIETQYRYRDLQTTTSGDANLSGWTQTGSSASYGEYGSWSDWGDAPVTGSDTRQVDTQTAYRTRTRTKETRTSSNASESGWTQTGSTSSYGAWSDWGDNAVAGSETREVETRTVYRTRTRTKDYKTSSNASESGWTQTGSTSGYGDYGAWSDWGDNAVAGSDTRQVDTRTVYRTQTRKKETKTSSNASESGWTQTGKTRNESFGAWDEWRNVPGQDPVNGYELADGSGRVETENKWVTGVYVYTQWYYRNGDESIVFCDEKHGDSVVQNGKTYYFDYSNEVYGNCYQYRTRRVTYSYTYSYERYVWSDWSGWTETPATKSENLNVESKTQYRYRDRPVIYTYSYERWTDWSAWSDWSTDAASSSDTVNVESKTQYRDRPIIYTYSYERWTDWSDWGGWSASPAERSETTDVDTKTQYRYQDRPLIYTYTYQKWSDWSAWSGNAVEASATRQVETQYRYRER